MGLLELAEVHWRDDASFLLLSSGNCSGAAGNSKWWCASFGANAGAGAESDYQQPDYLGAGRAGAAQYRVAPKVCPIQDDEDGHLSYKLGDIIENETHRCV